MNKIGIVLTTHYDNREKIYNALKSIINNTKNYNKTIIVFDNEGIKEKRDYLLSSFPEIKYFHIENQEKQGGLTYTWNEGCRICLNDNCETVILLNHDIECNNTLHFLIDASLNKEKKGIYSCTTNRAPWGNHLNQQSYIKNEILILDEYYHPNGPGGFCLALPKEVLLENKFNDTDYFDPRFPFDGNEKFFNERWYAKKGKTYIVRNCFIKHKLENSWTKLEYGNAKNIRNKLKLNKIVYHKSCHKSGLDTYIYKYISSIVVNKPYYLYIYDYCTSLTDKTPNDWFESNCDINNTWNYLLDPKMITKDMIQSMTPNFGFGNYQLDLKNIIEDNILIKGRHHGYNKICGKYYEAQILPREIAIKLDDEYFVKQKILNNNNNKELNIFIVRDLNTRELNFIGVNAIFDSTKNINRKKNNCKFILCDLKQELGAHYKYFIDYCNYINIDYGRIELIKDDNLGWCIIDVNNSPGGGPLTRLIIKNMVNLFIPIINNK